MSCIGDVLKLYRTRFHLSPGDLAKLPDISVNFLSQVENGKKKISFTKLGDIANKLGFSQELLLLVASEPPEELDEKQKKYFNLMQDSLLQYFLKR